MVALREYGNSSVTGSIDHRIKCVTGRIKSAEKSAYWVSDMYWTISMSRTASRTEADSSTHTQCLCLLHVCIGTPKEKLHDSKNT